MTIDYIKNVTVNGTSTAGAGIDVLLSGLPSLNPDEIIVRHIRVMPIAADVAGSEIFFIRSDIVNGDVIGSVLCKNERLPTDNAGATDFLCSGESRPDTQLKIKGAQLNNTVHFDVQTVSSSGVYLSYVDAVFITVHMDLIYYKK
jgi:hypothetical protein